MGTPLNCFCSERFLFVNVFYVIINKMREQNTKTKNMAQEKQDSIFKKMSASKKIKLTSELSSFCLKLNSLNGNNKSRKTSSGDSQDSWQS